MTSASLMHEAGHSKPVLWDTQRYGVEWWEGDSEWGTHVHLWQSHVDVWQGPPQCCDVIVL